MLDELEYVNHVKKEMALHMLQTGRRDLVPHALQMLPNADKVNTTNNAGLTPLQMAALRGDTNVVRFQTDFDHDLWIIFKVPWRLEYKIPHMFDEFRLNFSNRKGKKEGKRNYKTHF